MSFKNITNKNLFNLLNNNLEDLTIEEEESKHNCQIIDNENNIYEGFILAKSEKGNALTICEVDFHISDTDDKYHPRLIFKRTDTEFKANNAPKSSNARIISFHKGDDGYREFWEMISFLKGFEDLVDTEDFDSKYKIVSEEEVVNFLNNQDEYGELLQRLEEHPASSIHALTAVSLLKKYKQTVQKFINDNSKETEVQTWIDEDGDKFRQDRCMIFGLEYVNHVREGGVSGDRYDLLTRIGQDNEERVLVELKGPGNDVFKQNKRDTRNGEKTDYELSSSLSRAIPQILEYRKDLEDKDPGDRELEKTGEKENVKITKCIIVIGADVDDPRWRKNFVQLRRSLSSDLEIWTYDDLVHKMGATVENLERDRDKNNQSSK
jgi:hypothetical protein